MAPIFSFGSDLDVTNPSGMVRGADGTLYGMTRWGGAYGNGGLFSIAEDGSGYGVIASFLSPQSDFILGADGSFYLWTTSNSTYSSGAVSRIDVSGNVTVLYTFNGDASLGSKPMQIVFGPDGNLYGVASAGGTHKQGVLFRMGPDGSAYTVLQSFGGTGDGQQPNFLTLGSDGNLYGTTSYGGKNLAGTVFSLNVTSGAYTLIASAPGGANGSQPIAVLSGKDGNLYGVSYYGGAGGGVVFKVAGGTYSTVASLSKSNGNPVSLAVDSNGVLYGAQFGSYGAGAVFSVDPRQSPPAVVTQTSFLGDQHNYLSTAVGSHALVVGGDGYLYGGCPNDNKYGFIYKLAPAIQGITSLTVNPTEVVAGNSTTGTVILSQAAPAGGAKVALSGGGTVGGLPASVTVPAGKSQATFTITTSASITASTTLPITATYAGSSAVAPLTVDAESVYSLALSAGTVTAGDSVSGIVILAYPAPAGGAVVSLSTSGSGATVPASIKVAAGSSTATFTVTTSSTLAAQTTVNVVAKCYGSAQQASLTMVPETVTSVILAPVSVTAGTSSKATVTIGRPAPAAGLVLSLSSSISAAGVPATLKISAGKTSGSFTVTTSKSVTSSTSVTIKAASSANASSANLDVEPNVSFQVTLNPATIKGGANSTATITLTSAAPTGGLSFSIASSSSAATPQAGTVKIAAGKTTGTVTIATQSVTSTTSAVISATLGSTTEKATLKVTK